MDINILDEIARCYIESELEKIKYLKSQDVPKYIKQTCDALISYLIQGREISDKEDLLTLRVNLLSISEIVNLFLLSSPNKSSWWALPLIQECYDNCNINLQERNVLIIHSHEINDYSVYPNITSYFPPDFPVTVGDKPTDILTIPIEASYDISSIALIGHEVGHVYWHINFSLIEDAVKNYFKDAGKFIEYNLFNFTEFNKKIHRIESHIEEYLCDRIGSSLIGPAFDFALLKYFCSIPSNTQTGSDTHPPEKSRVEQSHKRLEQFNSDMTDLETAFKNLLGLIREIKGPKTKPPAEDIKLQSLASEIFQKSNLGTFYTKRNLDEIWKKVKPELDAFRPPVEKVGDHVPASISPIESLVTSCIYYHGSVHKNSNEFYINSKKNTKEKDKLIIRTLIKHIKYAISLYNFVKSSHEKYCQFDYDSPEWNNTLWKMRKRTSGGKLNPVIIVPTIDPKVQYGANSVDLRLGNSFLISKPSRYTHIDPEPNKSDQSDQSEQYLDHFFDYIEVPIGYKFILHPHQFVLASTLEYISLPYDFYALVLGRSSWGRMGLNIATATTVQAGYKGCLTLELRNLSETPLPLKVGLRIAQLCLIPVPPGYSTKAGYFTGDVKYIGPVSVELPKIRNDPDWIILNNFKSFSQKVK